MVSFCMKKPRVPTKVVVPVPFKSPPYAKAYPTDQKANPPPALSNKFHSNTVIQGSVSVREGEKSGLFVHSYY